MYPWCVRVLVPGCVGLIKNLIGGSLAETKKMEKKGAERKTETSPSVGRRAKTGLF